MPANLAGATRQYGPLLDDMRRAMADHLGVLYWLPRQETELATTAEGDSVVRVGPDLARGVNVRQLVPRVVTQRCNEVLARHGMPEVDRMTGSRTGQLRFTSVDGSGVAMHFFLKDNLEYWVDVPSHEAVPR